MNHNTEKKRKEREKGSLINLTLLATTLAKT